MRRHKRDRVSHAFSRGYHAGLEGHSYLECPFSVLNVKESWLCGWREGRMDYHQKTFRLL